MTTILKSALEVADLGFCCLPVHRVIGLGCTCGSPSCKKQGKHPKLRHWQNLATTKAEALQKRFASNDSNLGIATGTKSELIVIDIDPKNGGNESFNALTKRFGALDEHTLVANTGGGGQHLYYHSNSQTIGNFNGSVFGAGIDIKGNGGFVVGAPSNHISGGDYYWRDGLYQPATLPDELEQELLNYTKTPKTKNINDKNPIFEGKRNLALARIAGSHRAKGNNFDAINELIQKSNLSRCQPPLDRKEVEAIARSISSYPKGHSRNSFRDFWLACIYNDQTKLDIGTKSVLSALSFLMGEDGSNCTPPQTLIAMKAGCSRPTVSKHLNLAMKFGWLKIIHIPKTNGEKGIYCKYIPNIPTQE